MARTRRLVATTSPVLIPHDQRQVDVIPVGGNNFVGAQVIAAAMGGVGENDVPFKCSVTVIQTEPAADALGVVASDGVAKELSTDLIRSVSCSTIKQQTSTS